jgi:hypothetical protein
LTDDALKPTLVTSGGRAAEDLDDLAEQSA